VKDLHDQFQTRYCKKFGNGGFESQIEKRVEAVRT
jgi:hypothetical protein